MEMHPTKQGKRAAAMQFWKEAPLLSMEAVTAHDFFLGLSSSVGEEVCQAGICALIPPFAWLLLQGKNRTKN